MTAAAKLESRTSKQSELSELQHESLRKAMAILAGDSAQSQRAQAYRQIYDSAHEQMFALALRLVRNRSDAEDVLCEAFKQVWERPRQYQAERGPVVAWLMVITRTRALDSLRRRKHQMELKSAEANTLDASDDTQLSAPQLIGALQENSAVAHALLQLTEEQQRMLDLAYFHDMSHQEICERTGLALGTVKSHIRRGQQALRLALEAQGFTAQALHFADLA